ncbi:hypothetical protein [Mycolicibacterium alvei]|uniref:Uncharacterized protein n=1 Tax=Mycolicibacterium alvei TaxID=67081 RepID=A0A6N4V2F4_9MYCO|nr:hypothetical protein [Mycolicibacterium alvei]MCV6998854.1 hypothetical protein [Mycolicibacterium alvei]BBX30718.1 hypothetical protein MALV_58430 [Mycolicibacterium alvei]
MAITITAVGLLLAVAACFFPAIFGAAYGNFHSLLATVLINIGTTLMLAAALIVVDKWLVHVEQAAEHRATEIVDDRTRELRSQTEDLATRVAALQEALDGRLAEKDADRADRFANVAREASFDTVTSALEAANDVGALATGSVEVPSGTDLDAPRVFMCWAPRAESDDRRSSDQSEPLLFLSVDGADRTHVAVEWPDDKAAIEVLEELLDELNRSGNARLAQAFSPEALFANLARALSEATRIRTDSSGSGFTGATYEWLAEGWLVTDKGLFSTDHGLVIDQGSIKFPVPMMTPREIRAARIPAQQFASPDGVDPQFWELAVERTKHHVLSQRTTSNLGLGPIPDAYTSRTSPRRHLRHPSNQDKETDTPNMRPTETEA